LKHQAQITIATFGTALSLSSRADVRKFFTECLSDSHQLYNQAVDVMASKGILVRDPIIAKPTSVEYIQRQSFLAGFFGDTRPLTAAEIAHVSRNIEVNFIGQRWVLGFAQVGKVKQVSQYMQRGQKIATNHISIFYDFLKKDQLPIPSTWDSVITDSTVPPFSDKLMMFQVGMLNASSMANYGIGLSLSPRRDIAVAYARLLSEVGLYAEDGMNIMIDHNWMEKPPQAIDRKELVK
jgi:hypothetical protein